MYEEDDDVECLDDPISLVYDEKQRMVTEDDIVELESSSDDETEEPELVPTSHYGKNTFVLPVTFFDVYRNVRLLRKCRPLSIKIVDCGKHPKYYKFKKRQDENCEELNSRTANYDSEDQNDNDATCTEVFITPGKDDRTNKILLGSKTSLPKQSILETKHNGVISETCKDSSVSSLEEKETKGVRSEGHGTPLVQGKKLAELKDSNQVDLKRNIGLIGLAIAKVPLAELVTEAFNAGKAAHSKKRVQKDHVFKNIMKTIGTSLNNLGTVVIPVTEENKNGNHESDANYDIQNKISEQSSVNNVSSKLETDNLSGSKDKVKLNSNSPTRCSLKISCPKILEKALRLQEGRGSKKKPADKKSKKGNRKNTPAEAESVKLNLKRKNPGDEQFYIVEDEKLCCSERIQDVPQPKMNAKKEQVKKKARKPAHAEPEPPNFAYTNLNVNIHPSNPRLHQNSQLPLIPDYTQDKTFDAWRTSDPKKCKLDKNVPREDTQSNHFSLRQAELISELIVSQIKPPASSKISNPTNVPATEAPKPSQNKVMYITLPKPTQKSVTATDKSSVPSENKIINENKIKESANVYNTQPVLATILNTPQKYTNVKNIGENYKMDSNQFPINVPVSQAYNSPHSNLVSSVAHWNRHYANIPGNKVIKLRGSTTPLHLQRQRHQNQGFPIETVVNRPIQGTILNRPVQGTVVNRSFQEKQVTYASPWSYPPPNTNIATYIPNYRMPNPNMMYRPDRIYPTYWPSPISENSFPYIPKWNFGEYNQNIKNTATKLDIPVGSVIGSKANGEPIKKINITATPPKETVVADKEIMLKTLNGAINETGNTSYLDVFVHNHIANDPKHTNTVSKVIGNENSVSVSLPKKTEAKLKPMVYHSKTSNHSKNKYISEKQPSKGYSPPILPIPTYQKVLEILSKDDVFEKNLMQRRKVEHRMTDKKSKLDHYDSNTLKRKLISIEHGKHDSAKKISIEEYKKRVNGDDGNVNNDVKPRCEIIRNVAKSVVVDNQDLGYDSDATVKL